MPLRIPLTNIHFYIGGTVSKGGLQGSAVSVLSSFAISNILHLPFYVNMVQTEGFQTKEVIINNDQ